MTARARDVAKWFIQHNQGLPQNSKNGNMKLQKLLYFSQLVHMARTGDVLFSDPIHAFEHGSVVEDVMNEFHAEHRLFVVGALQSTLEFDESDTNTMKTVKEVFGSMTAEELSELNHEHYAWEVAHTRSKRPYGYAKSESIISVDELRKELDTIHDILSAHNMIRNANLNSVKVDNKEFHYNSDKTLVTDEIIAQLKKFRGDEESYMIYIDEKHGLVIY